MTTIPPTKMSRHKKFIIFAHGMYNIYNNAEPKKFKLPDNTNVITTSARNE